MKVQTPEHTGGVPDFNDDGLSSTSTITITSGKGKDKGKGMQQSFGLESQWEVVEEISLDELPAMNTSATDTETTDAYSSDVETTDPDTNTIHSDITDGEFTKQILEDVFQAAIACAQKSVDALKLCAETLKNNNVMGNENEEITSDLDWEEQFNGPTAEFQATLLRLTTEGNANLVGIMRTARASSNNLTPQQLAVIHHQSRSIWSKVLQVPAMCYQFLVHSIQMIKDGVVRAINQLWEGIKDFAINIIEKIRSLSSFDDADLARDFELNPYLRHGSI